MNVYLSITIAFLIFLLVLSLIPLAFKIKALVSDTYRNVQTEIHRVSSFFLLGISAILLIVSAIFIHYQDQREALKKNYRKNSPKRYKATSFYSSPYNITKWSYTLLGALFIGSSIFYGATIEKVLKDNKKEDTIFIYASLVLASLISILLLFDFYLIYKPQHQKIFNSGEKIGTIKRNDYRDIADEEEELTNLKKERDNNKARGLSTKYLDKTIEEKEKDLHDRKFK